ncbi:hypothetical protein Bbelb_049600 [Branchiostoma belcheri]|nr:hypothetical protein Bbelb_049600 [Branchiostoma belcheri]
MQTLFVYKVFVKKTFLIRSSLSTLPVVDEEGIRADEEGIRTDEEGIRADVEGIRTDVEGTSIRADVEGIRTYVEGIRADTHACTYGPPYSSIKHPLRSIVSPRCGPLFTGPAAHRQICMYGAHVPAFFRR